MVVLNALLVALTGLVIAITIGVMVGIAGFIYTVLTINDMIRDMVNVEKVVLYQG